jgi:hypothetical protein
MGPMILLDKSAMQSLSAKESRFLSKHFSVVIPPVLITEILADLSKTKTRKLPPAMEVMVLSRKLPSMDSHISVHYRQICIGSLLGLQEPPMDGRPVVGGGVPLKTKDGKTGLFFEEPEEWKLIRNWQRGAFSAQDMAYAQRWRQMTDALDLDRQKRLVRKLLQRGPDLKNIDEVAGHADKILENPKPDRQYRCITGFMDQLGLSNELRLRVLGRWQAEGRPSFTTFAPYAAYCNRVNMIFSLSVVSDLVSTRPTNRVDLEYLYYLPFCMVFCSGDGFHETLCLPFLRGDPGWIGQSFIGRDVLKKDLEYLVTEWDGLSGEEKKVRSDEYGSYPPPREELVTHRLWKKHMKPWEPGSGNLKLDAVQQKRLMKEMQPMLDAIKEYEQQKSAGA